MEDRRDIWPSSTAVEISGQECRVTASIGVACSRRRATTCRRSPKTPTWRCTSPRKRARTLPFLHQGDQDPIDRAAHAGNACAARSSSMNRVCIIRQAIETGEITGVEALLRWNIPISEVPAHPVHPARRGDRTDRADRPLGARGSLRAEHGLAEPGLPPMRWRSTFRHASSSIRICCTISTMRCRRAACCRSCWSSRSPKA